MAKSEKSIYQITILNWAEHNSKHKDSYKRTMIANNFCTDSKIQSLSMNSRWLFLNLLLTCGDLCRDTVEMSSKRLRDMLECNRNIDGVLAQLESLQLLTVVKVPLIEVKLRELKEVKLKEKNNSSVVENSTSLVPIISKSPGAIKKSTSKSPKQTFLVETVQDFEHIFTEQQKRNFFELYPEPDFFKREFLKMNIWLDANPRRNRKALKGWTGFVSNWLDGNWSKYQKTIPANKADLSSISKADLENRISKLFEVKSC